MASHNLDHTSCMVYNGLMKIYFTASVFAKEKLLNQYQEIINLLQKKGHKVAADHILQATESSIRLRSNKERLTFHEKIEKYIEGCDFLVAETSYPSTSIGYEIALGIRLGKHVLVLYSGREEPLLLGQHPNEKLIAQKYTSRDMNHILDEFIQYVQGKHDLRFTFFISSRIVNYLDKISRKYKIPKAAYIRQLIEHDMKNKKLE